MKHPATLFGRWLGLVCLTALLSGGLLAGCGDETPAVEDETETDTGAEDVGGDQEDAGAEETGEDLALDESDASEEPDVEQEPDAPVDPCEGTISCFDPGFERPRAAICTNAGMPTGTSCQIVEGGGEACCVPPFACETDEDCEAAREEEGHCVDQRFGCTCNVSDGSCSSFVCATNAECDEGELCRDGECVDDARPDDLVARIVTRVGTIEEDESIALLAVAVDPDDPTVVFDDEPISWSTSESDRVAITTDGTITGGSEAGDAVITATVTANGSDPGDSITVGNHDSYGGDDLLVIVVDENSRRPLAGATLWIEPEGGEAFAQEMGESSQAEVDVGDAETVTISALHPDYQYVTHVGIDATGSVFIALPPVGFAEVTAEEQTGAETRECVEPENPADETLCYDLDGVGAFVGLPDFDVLPNSGEVDVAITGFSLGNSLLDLNFELIVGPNIDRDISNGPIPVDDLAEIPGGVSLVFNRDPLVSHYVVNGLPGHRALWTLGGRVSLSDNPTLLPDILEQIDGDLQIGQIIAVVLPLFESFYSGVIADVEIEITDDLDLVELNAPLSVPMARRIHLNPPDIPELEDQPLETAIFLAGAMVPGKGFVPLGITAAVDDGNGTDLDGVLDGDTETDEIDPVPMSLAPIHGGIQSPGTHYVLVSLALALSDPPGGARRRENSVGNILRVPAGEFLPATVDFAAETFPMTADGSTYNNETRTITIVPATDQDSDFHRVLFRARRGQAWQVHLPDGVTSYVMPNPGEAVVGFQDRTQRQDISVISVALVEGDGGLSYEDLITPGGDTFLNLVDIVSEFAILDISN